MYDIIIIGAGPAGLTAAIYALRSNKKVLVLEAKSYGGQIINANNIENYPAISHISGYDFATNLYNQAKDLGATIKFEGVIEIKNGKNKRVVTTSNSYDAKAIIIATGCEDRKLGLDNENKFIGRGISYCATCDGAFYKDKIVSIVGGGNTAVDDALYLASIAKEVYLIHRRSSLKADDKTINLLRQKSNVHFLLDSVVTKINGEEKLESILVNDKVLKTDGLFIAIGKIPVNSCFNKIVNIDENGYVISGGNCHTNRKGIFVAGDIRKKNIRQLVTATSDGAIAACEAVKYLK